MPRARRTSLVATLGIAVAALLTATLALPMLPAAAQPQAPARTQLVAADPAPTPTRAGASAVAGNGEHACAILGSGTLQCWNGQATDATGAATPPTGVRFTQIAASGSHSCGVVNDGDATDGGPLLCWGAAYSEPTPTGSNFLQVELAPSYACARDRTWHLSCWGSGSAVAAPADVTFADIGVGSSHACGIVSGGVLRCWGYDYASRVSGPNAATGTFKEVASGGDYSCAIRTPTDGINGGSLECWGTEATTAGMPTSGYYRDIQGTATGACAIEVLSANVVCWGGLRWSSPSGTFTYIDGSQSGVCGITTDGWVDCFLGPVTRTLIDNGPWGYAEVHVYAGESYDLPLTTWVSPAPAWSLQGIPSSDTPSTGWTTNSLPTGLSLVDGRIVGSPQLLNDHGFIWLRSVGSVFLFETRYFVEVHVGPLATLDVTVDGTGHVEGDTATVRVAGYDRLGNYIHDWDAPLSSSIATDVVDYGVVTFAFDSGDVQTTARDHTITATWGSIQGSTTVSVAPLVSQLQLSLSPTSQEVHSPVTARIDGVDVAGLPVIDLTSRSTLASTVTADTIVDSSITPTTPGARTVTASYGTLSATAVLSGTPGPLASVVVTPMAANADTDDTVAVSVEGFDVYGNSRGDVTDQAVLTSSYRGDQIDGDEVTFAFEPEQAATTARTHAITATLPGGITGIGYVEVAPLITQLRLTLTPDTLVVHDRVTVRVDGLDAGGTARADLTPYAAVDSSVASDILTFGHVTPETLGTRTLTASYDTLTTTTRLTATEGPLASITVEMSDDAVATGDIVTATVWGFDEYGNPLGDLTAQATITSEVAGDEIDGNEITFAFDPAAQVTTEVVHTLTATIGSVSNSTQVTVAPLVETLELRLSSLTATIGDTIVVTVVALDGDGAPITDVSAHLTVTSDQPGDVVTGNTVTFTHASPHLITARYGTLAASATVEVSPSATALGDSGIDLTPLTLGLGLLGLGVLIGGLRLRARRG